MAEGCSKFWSRYAVRLAVLSWSKGAAGVLAQPETVATVSAAARANVEVFSIEHP
jgi:hypothetical protein